MALPMMRNCAIDRRRIAILLALAALVAVTAASGPAAAHNPACHQVAGSDGPHYDDDDRTGSDTAFEKNKNLGGSDFGGPGHAADGCSVGNSQSPHADN